MYTYTVLDKKYIFQKLEKGECVLIADFNGMKCVNCETLRVEQINYYKESSDAVFYTRAEVTDE